MYAVLVTWHEVTGNWPTLEQLHDALRPFQLKAVLTGLSRLSAMLRTWQNDLDFNLDSRLTNQFLPTYARAIDGIRRSGDLRIVFTRLSLLYVAKQACIVCDLEGGLVVSGSDLERILTCCLMANDLVLGRTPVRGDSLLERAASLLPFSDYVPKETYPMELARSQLFLDEIVPSLRGRPDFIDLAAEFERCLGLSPLEFCEFAFAASIKFMANLEEQFRNPSTALLLTPDYFRHTILSVEHVTEALKRLSVPLSEVKNKARGSKLSTDFLVFQQHPLVILDDHTHLCPDPGFLLDKGGKALYWTLHAGLPADRRPTLMSFWGNVFEHYGEWLFRQSYQGRGSFKFFPKFQNGDEAFDAYVLEGSRLMLFEFKSSVLSVQAKYGFSPELLDSELKTKIVEGTEGRRKGLAQLREGLIRLLEGDAVEDLDAAAVKQVYPVLVFADPSFVAPYLNSFYNANFDREGLRRYYRRVFTPVFSLTIGDLEDTLPHTAKHGLSEILDSYWHENRTMNGTLSRSKVPLSQGETPSSDPVRERYKRFADDLQERLFEVDSENQNGTV